MSTTLAWLQTKEWSNLCFCLEIDGFPYVASTVANPTTALTASYAGASWSQFLDGLDIIGTMSQEVAFFDPGASLQPGTLNFRILEDDAGALLENLLRLSSTDDIKSRLTGDLAPNATTVPVAAKADLSAADTNYAYIGHEAVKAGAYTTVGGVTTELTGCTRGVYALWETAGGDPFSPPHLVDRNTTTGEGSAPLVTMDHARTWYNRGVALRLFHYENGAWCSRANSMLVWAGRIKSWSDGGNGWVNLECRDIRERLQDKVFSCQWSGEQVEGLYVDGSMQDVQAFGIYNSTAYAPAVTTIATVNTTRTWEEILSDLGTCFDTLSTSAVSVSIDVQDRNAASPRVALRVQSTGTAFDAADVFYIGLAPHVWWMLGFDERVLASTDTTSNGRRVTMKRLTSNGQGEFYLVADLAPVRYPQAMATGATVSVTNELGTWQNQPTAMLPLGADPAADGLVRVGDNIFSVTYDSSTVTFKSRTGGNETYSSGVIREGDEYNPARMRQVLWLQGGAGTVLAQLLLSTGTAGYNHSTLDILAVGIGLAFPASAFNLASLAALDEVAPEWRAYIDAPVAFSTLLEEVLAATNRHLVFRDNKLEIVPMPTETANAAGAVSFTEDNKADPLDRARVGFAREGVINKATFKYNKDPIKGETQEELTVVLQGSAGEYGSTGIKHEGAGFASPATWNACVIPALSYFTRPPAIVERTCNVTLAGAGPCDLGLLTDNYVCSPTAGTRGVSSLPCWVLATSFDWKSGKGTARLVFAPMSVGRGCLWSPSARVTGYVAGTKTLTCTEHTYSHATTGAGAAATVDAARFPVGSKIRIVEIDPADPASPSTDVDTVASQSGNDIVLTTGFAGYDANKAYDVEADDIATVVAAQRTGYAFIADDANDSTGYATDDARHYGADSDSDAVAGSVSYATEYARPYNLAADTGEPLSTHKAALLASSVNNYLGRKSNQVLVCDFLAAAVDDSAAKGTSKLYYGPMPIPIYGHQNRVLKVRLLGRADTSGQHGTATVKLSRGPVAGSSTASTDLIYPDGPQTTATVTIAYGTTNAWSDEATISVVCDGSHPGLSWLTIEIVSSSVATTTYLAGVWLAEDEL